jgi:hypothetical protein
MEEFGALLEARIRASPFMKGFEHVNIKMSADEIPNLTDYDWIEHIRPKEHTEYVHIQFYPNNKDYISIMFFPPDPPIAP